MFSLISYKNYKYLNGIVWNVLNPFKTPSGSQDGFARFTVLVLNKTNMIK